MEHLVGTYDIAELVEISRTMQDIVVFQRRSNIARKPAVGLLMWTAVSLFGISRPCGRFLARRSRLEAQTLLVLWRRRTKLHDYSIRTFDLLLVSSTIRYIISICAQDYQHWS